jgi:hypothetical protein
MPALTLLSPLERSFWFETFTQLGDIVNRPSEYMQSMRKKKKLGKES